MAVVRSATSAPATAPVTVDPVLAAIRDQGLNHSQVSDTLDYLCNVIGQRLTGSPSQQTASQWTRDTLQQWGLANAHLEPWGPFGQGWSVQRYSLQVTEPYTIVLTGYPKAWSPGFDEPRELDVVYLEARNGADLAKFAGKLSGKAVLLGLPRAIDAHFEPQAARMTAEQLNKLSAAPAGRSKTEMLAPSSNPAGPATTRATQPSVFAQTAAAAFATEAFSFAARQGAALIIDPSARGDGGTLFVTSALVPGPATQPATKPATRQSAAPTTRPKPYAVDAPVIPAQVTLTNEDFNRLVRMISHGQRLKIAITLNVKFYPPKQSATFNTIAEIPGSDLKDQIVMVGGHLDSWHSGTGATDNAVGAACAMEAARIIQALHLHPRRTIRVGLWTGEEEGLLGSSAYVKEHFGSLPDDAPPASQPVTRPYALVKTKPEYEKLSVYFNLDNGTGKIRGIYAQSSPAAAALFRGWLQPFADLDAATVTLANTGSTDHISFDRIGLPGFQFIQDPIEYFPRTHHSNADVFDRIQIDDMKQASTIMAAFLWDAANMDQRFPRKK
jgi:hypothetical protein